jgi:hypothetical protein
MTLDNIEIPSTVHYISIFITMKRNGDIWLSYPCIELGEETTDYEPYETDIYNTYYNKNSDTIKSSIYTVFIEDKLVEY